MRTVVTAAFVVLAGCGSNGDSARTVDPSQEQARDATPTPAEPANTPATEERPTKDARLPIVDCTGPRLEACENVRAIAEAARAHFAKTGKLCGPARLNVPAMPPANPFELAKNPGMDFTEGDVDNAWVCLGFKPKTPTIRFSYSYTVGSCPLSSTIQGPKCTGAASFEVGAQGDLNADGLVFSTFVIVGDGSKLSPLYVAKPEE